MRKLALAAVLCVPLSCGSPVVDFSGVWKMTETDSQCRHAYSQCWVLIEQQGDRATIRSWGGDGWTCSGRGAVENGRLKFRWAGNGKDWSGSADLERRGSELVGTYGRGPAPAPVQYCRGVFIRAAPEKAP